MSSTAEAAMSQRLRATTFELAGPISFPGDALTLYVGAGPAAGSRAIVGDEPVLVGKDPACHLFLPEPSVSRRHFQVSRAGETVVIRDLGSTNGTLLDGTRIREAFLRPGARITAGTVEIEVRRLDDLGADAAPPAAPVGQGHLGGLMTATPMMRTIFDLLRRTAGTERTVLLKGETGVGKSTIARTIHEISGRAGPLVVFDCAAVAPTLIESELFGAEKGAFTGADKSRPGACEQAQGGTLLLDDVEDLPLELQPKLLRVLEEKEVRRLGSTKPVALDVRMIAACKVDLAQAVEDGRFRRDLYYRLAVLDVELPPLRDRPDDVPLLYDHFCGADPDAPRWEALGPALQGQLLSYSWPGNLRELRNVQERIALIGPENFSTAALTAGRQGVTAPVPPLPVPVSASGAETQPALAPAASDTVAQVALRLDGTFKDAKQRLIDEFERHYLEALMARHAWRIASAAREADLNRKYLYDLLEKHGLHRRSP